MKNWLLTAWVCLLLGCGGSIVALEAEKSIHAEAEKVERKQPSPKILTDNKKIHYDFVDRIDYNAGRYLDIFILTERKTHKQYLLVFATNNGSPPHLALSVTPMDR